MNVCAVIPTYENERTIEDVVRAVRAHVPAVIVVDDGSGNAARTASERIAAAGMAHVVFRDQNGGKGAAVKTGLEHAHRLGYTHALQIDADGQHDVADVPKLLEASRREPTALVLGQPVFDESAPSARRMGRLVSVFWCAVETGSRKIGDPLCGYRVYPVEAALAVRARGDAMDFDPEIAVRLAWAGHPIVHVQTKVRYLSRDEGGVSHYRTLRDTLLISWMHTRLCTRGLLLLLGWRPRAALARGP